MTVRLPYGTRVQLHQLLKNERRLAKELADSRQLDLAGLSHREVAAVRAARRLQLFRARERGELLDSVDRLAALGVLRELQSRGWDRSWPDYPEEARGPGRWPGSQDGGFPEKMSLRLPVDLEHRVRSACWYTSADAIEALLDWRDRYPQIVRRRHEAPAGQEKALQEYRRLAARVTTTGEVWRAGIRRGIEARSV
ncbi:MULTISPECIES: hypothetical protein [unclassified Streptomyces]|uniref:hypothetical protein n=1 Tax=unclassified Streptomyces TaxID=2593676 RepID=UPI00115FE028|nr:MULTISPECIES: hypothetical protein [unclassified Streptomyces]